MACRANTTGATYALYRSIVCPSPVRTAFFNLVAWQLPLVVPLPMARQSSFVAPPGVVRQADSAAPLCVQAQQGLFFLFGGVAGPFGRATPSGATE